ncbi:MAG: hypothetical protein ABI647_05990 [Gemmatimonadota bacterium]
MISDGAHLTSDPAGNRDFFFLPPLFPNPRTSPNWNTGEFNAKLQPAVIVCELDLPLTAVPGDVTINTPCKPSGYLVTFPFAASGPNTTNLHLPGTRAPGDDGDDEGPDGGHYHAMWTVPVLSAVFYRIQVWQGTIRIGFADLESRNAGQDLRNANNEDFVVRKDGSTVNIKFRIENRALCTPAGDYTKPPCASTTVNLGTGGSVTTTISNLPTGMVIPAQTGSTTTSTFTIQPCGPGGIQVDLPTFGSCVSVTTNPALVNPLTNPAIVFVCDYPPDLSTLPHDQTDLVTLHGRHSATFTEALIEVDAHCPAGISMTPTIGRMLASVVHGEWRAAGRELAQLIQPKPLMAMFVHAGGGGLTKLQSEFQFALPCKMQTGQGDGAVAAPGATITATAVVTDLFGGPCKNAKVHFAVGSGGGSISASTAVSDANGLASVQWTLGPSAGTNTLNASGFGIASPATHGPRGPGDFVAHSLSYGCGSPPCNTPAQTFDPFIPKYLDFDGIQDAQIPSTDGIQLKNGTITFTATNAAPVNLFGFGSGGYTYLKNVQFDPSNPRIGSGQIGDVVVPSAGWFTPSFVPGAGWVSPATASFGSRLLACAINTTQAASADPVDHFVTAWKASTDILVRKSFSTTYAGTITLAVRIDNDLQIWLDGVNITPNAPATGGGGFNSPSGWWFHDGCADAANPVFVVTGVPAGSHLLAIRGHDFSGGSYLDVKADLAP